MEDDVDGRIDLLSAPLGLEVALVIDWRPGRHHNIDGRARDRFAEELDRYPMRTLDSELARAHDLVQPDRGRAGGDAVLLLVALLVILELLARLLDQRELPDGRLEHRGHIRRRCKGDEVVELVADLDLKGELVAGGEQRDGRAIGSDMRTNRTSTPRFHVYHRRAAWKELTNPNCVGLAPDMQLKVAGLFGHEAHLHSGPVPRAMKAHRVERLDEVRALLLLEQGCPALLIDVVALVRPTLLFDIPSVFTGRPAGTFEQRGHEEEPKRRGVAREYVRRHLIPIRVATLRLNQTRHARDSLARREKRAPAHLEISGEQGERRRGAHDMNPVDLELEHVLVAHLAGPGDQEGAVLLVVALTRESGLRRAVRVDRDFEMSATFDALVAHAVG